ncbi:MAG TPA: aldo/keto reductase [Chloroflexota bacterium]|nr:aldo/keto reductase [Chloroflexota bacterium]
MDPFEKRRLGRTDLHVTALGCGTATLGDAREAIPDAQSDLTLEVAYGAGIAYFDSAPWYGRGKSEVRVGRVLASKPRSSFALSTKVGRVLFRPRDPASFMDERWKGGLPFDLRFDYTRDGVIRAYEDSLQRLGMNSVDALLIHDLDAGYHGEDGVEAKLRELDDHGGGGFRALLELKGRGEIKAIGAGINPLGMMPRFLDRFPIDFFLVAMPYTLLNQEALESELPRCQEKGVGIVIGAPFASGLLARGVDDPRATYGYRPVEQPIAEKTRRIAAVCARHGVPLGAAALQFPLAHPSVAAIIPGPNHPEQVRTNLEWVRWPIPAALWEELKGEGLLRKDAPTPAR